MSSKRQKTQQPSVQPVVVKNAPELPLDQPDDRYPGSFFRVPGVAAPGKTTWSIAR